MRKFATGKRSGGDSVTGLSSALASGWMAVRGTRRRRPVDRGFVLSDHADWPGLLAAIRATGAQRIGVTHGSTGPMIRHLRESLAIDAFDLPTRFRGEARDDADEPATPDHADPPEAGA
jgi:putative mRNA 3-end processing factor